MTRPSYRDELAALKRENRRLLRELEARQARRDDHGPAPGNGDSPRGDVSGPEPLAAYNGHANLGEGPGEQPRPALGENGSADPDEDLQAISEALDRFRAMFEGQWRGHAEDLSTHLDQLGAEIAELRSEVAAARAAAGSGSMPGDAVDRRLIVRPAKEPAREVVVEVPADSIWRRLRRPWFYLPLLWGLIMLALALLYFAYLAG